MKRLRMNSRIIIWLSCASILLVVTFLVAYGYLKYGVPGATMVFFLAIAAQQPFKIIYEWYACHWKYDLNLAVRTTNCWTIYQIVNSSLCTGGVFSYLIMVSEMEALHIPKSVWLVAIIILACVLSIWPIQPFVRKEKYEGKRRRPTNLINTFTSRFVILYTFVVYYFIAYVDATEKSIIPSLCVLYLGVDRLITMYNTVRNYEQQEYYSLFRDTVKWIRERRKK